jgi:hypothetical protein
LSWTLAEILEEVKKMESYQKEIKTEVLKLCWYMRGGVTYSEAICMSFEERSLIGKIVKDNLETTKKTGMAFF